MAEHSELPWRRGIGYRDDLILDAKDRIVVRAANNSENTKNWEIDAPFIVLAANHHHALVNALTECAIRCRYDGDLFHDQQNEMRRDASWKAQEMAEAALAALKEATSNA